MDANAKIAVVNRYVEAFDKGDINIIRDMYADDATVEDPVGTDPHIGIEAICRFYENALAAGAKLELSGTPRCAGNAVAFPFNVTMPGLHFEVIDVFELDDEGRVSSMRAYWGPENMISEPQTD
tara:strand:+ start:124169 stop:124540 length:372 start_codon:yes stop_codon:yes gene_type:complete